MCIHSIPRHPLLVAEDSLVGVELLSSVVSSVELLQSGLSVPVYWGAELLIPVLPAPELLLHKLYVLPTRARLWITALSSSSPCSQ